MLYQLLHDTPKNHKLKEAYDKALEIYKSGDLEKSKKLFEVLASEYDDSVSKFFLNNINNGQTWGVHKMTTK